MLYVKADMRDVLPKLPYNLPIIAETFLDDDTLQTIIKDFEGRRLGENSIKLSYIGDAALIAASTQLVGVYEYKKHDEMAVAIITLARKIQEQRNAQVK